MDSPGLYECPKCEGDVRVRGPSLPWFYTWGRICCYIHLWVMLIGNAILLLVDLVFTVFTVGMYLPVLLAHLLMIPGLFIFGLLPLAAFDYMATNRKKELTRAVARIEGGPDGGFDDAA